MYCGFLTVILFTTIAFYLNIYLVLWIFFKCFLSEIYITELMLKYLTFDDL